MSNDERIAAFTRWADAGLWPALVFDDNGHWAVTFAGSVPLPVNDRHDRIIAVAAYVEPDQWRDSPEAAIDAAIAGASERKP